MEQLNFATKLKDFFQKYKYVLLIVAVGIVLMLWPEQHTGTSNTAPVTPEIAEPEMETQLEAILSKISGAGRVEVMLTTARGEETLYQLDSDRTDTQARQDTVIISGSDRAQNGLVTQINPPTYLGAIVVCDGADEPTVRLNIVQAVSNATGLGADNISVLKMK